MKPKWTCAPISQFTEHPAQMRTLYELDDMATLTLQVYENDLDEWQPITATPDGKGGYFIISGHRRRMARLFAYALATWINQPDSGINEEEEGVHIELVLQAPRLSKNTNTWTPQPTRFVNGMLIKKSSSYSSRVTRKPKS